MAAPELINLAVYKRWHDRQKASAPATLLPEIPGLEVTLDDDPTLRQRAHDEVYSKVRQVITRLSTPRDESTTLRWGRWLEENGGLPIVKRVGKGIATAASHRLVKASLNPDRLPVLPFDQTLLPVEVEVRTIGELDEGLVINIPELEGTRGRLELFPNRGSLRWRVPGTRGGSYFDGLQREASLVDYRQFGQLADTLLTQSAT